MRADEGFTRKFYLNYPLISVIPAICVIIDYILTFYLAGDTTMIISWEASPFVRFAVIHNIMIPYLAAIVLFYFGASYAVLHILSGSVYYRFGVLLIMVISITHVFGGMSWHFRNAIYSDGVLLMSVLSIVIAFIIFGISLVHEHRPA